MRRMTTWFAWLLLAAVSLEMALPPLARAAEPLKVRDAARRCTFELPSGWKAYEADELTTINAEFRERLPTAVHYERAYRPDGTPLKSYPYILVQTQGIALAGATYERIEHDFKAQPLDDAVLDSVQEGQVILDRKKNRIVMRNAMEVMGTGRVQCISVGHLGARGIVYLHAYSLDADLARHLPEFNAANDSFRYDPGAEFTPGPGTWVMIRNGSIFGALAGAAIGGLVALWTWYSRRHAAARQG